jgi:hypothetical protein
LVHDAVAVVVVADDLALRAVRVARPRRGDHAYAGGLGIEQRDRERGSFPDVGHAEVFERGQQQAFESVAGETQSCDAVCQLHVVFDDSSVVSRALARRERVVDERPRTHRSSMRAGHPVSS